MILMPMMTLVITWRAEPNLLSHTAHSISRKGVKKRDLSDVELRDILGDVLPHIRTDHVLPKDSEVLTSTIKRGLLSIPPSHMIGSDTIAVGGQSSASAWVRTRNMALFIKPRLFVPYFDEVKVKFLLFCRILLFPLYMVKDTLLHCTLAAAQCIVIGPVSVWVGVCVCGSVTTITRNCMHRSHQTGFVGKGSNHLQLIKFWPLRAPGKGVCLGAKFCALPYYSQHAVFASPLSTFSLRVSRAKTVIILASSQTSDDGKFFN